MPHSRDPQFTGSNQTEASIRNRELVVRLLRDAGPMSRSDLAERTQLRSSTLTYITRDLMEVGIVHSAGKREITGVGKPQQLLDIDPGFGCFLGVSLEAGAVSLLYVDARGKLLDRDYFDLGRDLHELPDILQPRVEATLKRLGGLRLRGMGVGVPGIVDPYRGLVLRSRWFNAENYPLRAVLKEVFEVPVTIDNDANLAAYAESERGAGHDVRDLIYFLVNSEQDGDHYAVRALGATLILNGRLHRGSCFAAGEIDNLLDHDDQVIVSAHDLLEIAKPDGEMTAALEHLTVRLGRVLASLWNVIDPGVVVLGGNIQIANERVLEAMTRQVGESTIAVPSREVDIRSGDLREHGVAHGGTIVAIENIFFSNRGVIAAAESDSSV